ncbi:MAG: hypothetical protein AAGC63_04535, partial [Propionicimonas sp.]
MTATHSLSDEALAARSAARRARRLGRLAPYALIVPAIAILVFSLGYPMFWQIVTSTQSFGLAQQFGKPPEFVGLENYLTVFNSPETWAVVVRSVAFCL